MKTFKKGHFSKQERKIIFQKVVTCQKLIAEIQRCKDYILNIKDVENNETILQWYDFLNLKITVLEDLKDELKERFEIEFENEKKGLINLFLIIPDLM